MKGFTENRSVSIVGILNSGNVAHFSSPIIGKEAGPCLPFLFFSMLLFLNLSKFCLVKIQEKKKKEKNMRE